MIQKKQNILSPNNKKKKSQNEGQVTKRLLSKKEKTSDKIKDEEFDYQSEGKMIIFLSQEQVAEYLRKVQMNNDLMNNDSQDQKIQKKNSSINKCQQLDSKNQIYNNLNDNMNECALGNLQQNKQEHLKTNNDQNQDNISIIKDEKKVEKENQQLSKDHLETKQQILPSQNEEKLSQREHLDDQEEKQNKIKDQSILNDQGQDNKSKIIDENNLRKNKCRKHSKDQKDLKQLIYPCQNKKKISLRKKLDNQEEKQNKIKNQSIQNNQSQDNKSKIIDECNQRKNKCRKLSKEEKDIKQSISPCQNKKKNSKRKNVQKQEEKQEEKYNKITNQISQSIINNQYKDINENNMNTNGQKIPKTNLIEKQKNLNPNVSQQLEKQNILEKQQFQKRKKKDKKEISNKSKSFDVSTDDNIRSNNFQKKQPSPLLNRRILQEDLEQQKLEMLAEMEEESNDLYLSQESTQQTLKDKDQDQDQENIRKKQKEIQKKQLLKQKPRIEDQIIHIPFIPNKYDKTIKTLQECDLPEEIPCRENEKKEILDFINEGLSNNGSSNCLYKQIYFNIILVQIYRVFQGLVKLPVFQKLLENCKKKKKMSSLLYIQMQ